LPILANIGSDACVDACGNLYLNKYFHNHQIKLYSLNSTKIRLSFYRTHWQGMGSWRSGEVGQGRALRRAGERVGVCWDGKSFFD